MKRSRLFFIILLVPILASKCIEFEGDSWVTLKTMLIMVLLLFLQTFLQDFVIRILCCQKYPCSILLLILLNLTLKRIR